MIYCREGSRGMRLPFLLLSMIQSAGLFGAYGLCTCKRLALACWSVASRILFAGIGVSMFFRSERCRQG